MAASSQQHIPIVKVNASSSVITVDSLAIEEPLKYGWSTVLNISAIRKTYR
jgi:uncharacterized protein with ACT and thioredoxin-like domain